MCACAGRREGAADGELRITIEKRASFQWKDALLTEFGGDFAYPAMMLSPQFIVGMHSKDGGAA